MAHTAQVTLQASELSQKLVPVTRRSEERAYLEWYPMGQRQQRSIFMASPDTWQTWQ
jgi:hypothetical protein